MDNKSSWDAKTHPGSSGKLKSGLPEPQNEMQGRMSVDDGGQDVSSIV